MSPHQHKTIPLPTPASGTASWNLIKISGRSVRTSHTVPKSLLLLLISLIPFDNELQKCYNMDVLNDVVYKRTTKRRTIRKNRRQGQRSSEEKEMWLPRLSMSEPILSNRKNGFSFLIEKCHMPRRNDSFNGTTGEASD